MGLFDDSLESALGKGLAHGLGSLGGAMIGAAIAGAIDSATQSSQPIKVDNSGINTEVKNQNIQISPRGEYKVVKCPGCGHRSSIVDGDGTADYCEYCGTAIGN